MEASFSPASFTDKLQTNLSRRPMAVATSVPHQQRFSYWSAIESDVLLYLKDVIPIRSPETVYDPMRHLTFAAPTTTASSLCVAACELVGGDRRLAIVAAASLHLMYAAIYTHEHLPLSDRPPARADRRVEHKYGPNIELLTGDGLIPFGIELVAQSMDLAQNNQDKILKVITEISRATGSQGMIDGQYRRFNLLQQSGNSYLKEIEYICKKKEGQLHACGGACGAILGGAGTEEIERLRKFGLFVGMIKGMVSEKCQGLEDKIEELKALALKEIECFSGDQAELISGLVDPIVAAL